MLMCEQTEGKVVHAWYSLQRVYIIWNMMCMLACTLLQKVVH